MREAESDDERGNGRNGVILAMTGRAAHPIPFLGSVASMPAPTSVGTFAPFRQHIQRGYVPQHA